MNIQKPSDELQREVISGIISVTSRPIILEYREENILCPTCSGIDPFCITCSGNERIDVVATQQIDAAVRWKSLEKKKYTPEGQYVEGDCTITMLHTPELESLLFKVKNVYVDDRKCVVRSWNLRGTPTNRIYMILYEDDTLKGYRI